MSFDAFIRSSSASLPVPHLSRWAGRRLGRNAAPNSELPTSDSRRRPRRELFHPERSRYHREVWCHRASCVQPLLARSRHQDPGSWFLPGSLFPVSLWHRPEFRPPPWESSWFVRTRTEPLTMQAAPHSAISRFSISFLVTSSCVGWKESVWTEGGPPCEVTRLHAALDNYGRLAAPFRFRMTLMCVRSWAPPGCAPGCG
jgi:hypothetical protein